MTHWRTPIYCYVSPAGNNKIADWYGDLPPSDQTFVDEFLKNMRQTREWSLPDYRARLAGGYGRLGELRWKMNRKEHRLLGFFKGGVWYAVIGCYHKQRVYAPAAALDTALRYMGQIERGEARTVEYDI